MKIIGDIGNTEVKICLVDSKFKIKKKVIIKTNEINQAKLKNKLKFLFKCRNNFKSIIFSSVVPKIYKEFYIFFKLNFNIKILEIKNLKLNKWKPAIDPLQPLEHINSFTPQSLKSFALNHNFINVTPDFNQQLSIKNFLKEKIKPYFATSLYFKKRN